MSKQVTTTSGPGKVVQAHDVSLWVYSPLKIYFSVCVHKRQAKLPEVLVITDMTDLQPLPEWVTFMPNEGVVHSHNVYFLQPT